MHTIQATFNWDEGFAESQNGNGTNMNSDLQNELKFHHTNYNPILKKYTLYKSLLT